MGSQSEKVGNRWDHYSIALIEKWMRIIKLDIFNSKSNIRPGDFIKRLYTNIMTKLSGLNSLSTQELKKFSMSISDPEIPQKSIVVKGALVNLRKC